jgi:hypothetical protein
LDLPPLVTTSPDGTSLSQAGVLGAPNTTLLYGGSEANDGSTPGLRFRGGFWFGQQGAFGIESEYFELEAQNASFVTGGDGSPILAVPFFNIRDGNETAQLISYPNFAAGRFATGSGAKLRSFLVNGRAGLCPTPMCLPDGAADRVDWIIGYRYLELKDDLVVAQELLSQDPSEPGSLVFAEGFRTKNEFNGLQLGVTYLANFRRVWLESLIRVAIGNTKQQVQIAGGTAITEDNVTENYVGGLFAQRTNIGTYQRDRFTMVPEVGATLGVRLTRCLHATVGYTLLYYPSVLRAGDQIDRELNPNLFPPEVDPFSGPLRPRFRPVEDAYWAHGVSVGGELRF